MLTPANSSYSEDYWRDRCGMPPREAGYGEDRRAWSNGKARPRRSLARRSRQALFFLLKAPLRIIARMGAQTGSRAATRQVREGSVVFFQQEQIQQAFTPRAPRRNRGVMLKLSAGLLAVVWLAGTAIVFLQPAPVGGSLGEAYASFVQNVPDQLLTGTALPEDEAGAGLQFDARLTSFQKAQEAALVALRGYLLTGSDGFKSEWADAIDRMDAAQTAIEVDSHGWTLGSRIVELRDLRKDVAALRAEEVMLADIANTANRYPGLRLYTESTDKTLQRADAMIDETLRAVLIANWPGAAARVDTLAHIRGSIRDLRASLNAYLPASATLPPQKLTADYAAFRAGLSELDGMGHLMPPADQARLDDVRRMLKQADAELAQILALKRTPRWDYADFAFKEKAMPLSERISAMIARWRTES